MVVYIGIDWSQSKHDFTFLSERGAMLAQFTIPHTHEGFLKLEETRRRLGVATSECAVGLETAHNLLIDFLWARGYSRVYVVPPKVVNSNRSRYRQSGAHTDQSDSFVLADLLRTDCGVRQPWHPDSLLTRQMRAKVNLISFLTQQILRLHNRLSAVLMRYYPAALQVFSCLSQIGTDFVQAYPTPQAAAALTFEQFVAFAGQHKYHHSQRLRVYFANLQASYPEAMPETVQVYQDEAPLLAARLSELMQAKACALSELQVLFKQHPDYAVFSSLPGAGDLLAPALLAMFGDDRQRFPTAVSIQALAGTCPVTQASGRSRFIHFRWSCNRDFRLIAQQWAKASLGKSIWANAYWRQVRPRCKSDSHAYRCLANRWLAILWKLWQLRQPYDETYHCKQRALRSIALDI
jgi:transposase